MIRNDNSGFAYGETARRRRGIAYQPPRQGGQFARPDARSREADDVAPVVTRADVFDSLAAALLDARDDGDRRLTCEFLESFDAGTCGADADLVEVGAVSAPFCEPHAEEAVEERGRP